MHIEHIEYTDFDGNKRADDLMFHLTETQVMEWLSDTDGGYTLDKFLETLMRAEKVGDIVGLFKDFLLRSYGEKTPDGKSFMKTKELREKFEYSAAFDALFSKMVKDPQEVARFFTAVIPADMASEIDKVMQADPDTLPPEVRDYVLKSKQGLPKEASVVASDGNIPTAQ